MPGTRYSENKSVDKTSLDKASLVSNPHLQKHWPIRILAQVIIVSATMNELAWNITTKVRDLHTSFMRDIYLSCAAGVFIYQPPATSSYEGGGVSGGTGSCCAEKAEF